MVDKRVVSAGQVHDQRLDSNARYMPVRSPSIRKAALQLEAVCNTIATTPESHKEGLAIASLAAKSEKPCKQKSNAQPTGLFKQVQSLGVDSAMHSTLTDCCPRPPQKPEVKLRPAQTQVSMQAARVRRCVS